MQPDFAQALLESSRTVGLHTAVETTGAASPAVLEQVLGETDLILFDIKLIDPIRHRAATGVANGPILANARRAAALGIPMVIRVPVIPGVNDDPNEMSEVGAFAKELGVSELHLLPYHKYGSPKYAALGLDYSLAELAPPPASQMEQLSKSLETLSLRVRIGG